MCNGPFGFGFVCELALSFCQATVVAPIQVEGGNFNVYDVRLKCESFLIFLFFCFLVRERARERREKRVFLLLFLPLLLVFFLLLLPRFFLPLFL